jgi:hypothetical protein
MIPAPGTALLAAQSMTLQLATVPDPVRKRHGTTQPKAAISPL